MWRKFRDGHRTFPDAISTGRECAANVRETLPSRAVLRGLRPRWPQTMRRAQISPASARTAWAMPSAGSLVTADALHPC
jgi:hypothetical protein